MSDQIKTLTIDPRAFKPLHKNGPIQSQFAEWVNRQLREAGFAVGVADVEIEQYNNPDQTIRFEQKSR